MPAVIFRVDFLFDRVCFVFCFFPVFFAESFGQGLFFGFLGPELFLAVFAETLWTAALFGLLAAVLFLAVFVETLWAVVFFEWLDLVCFCLPWAFADVRIKSRQHEIDNKYLSV
jgi:hypothetical protein